MDLLRGLFQCVTQRKNIRCRRWLSKEALRAGYHPHFPFPLHVSGCKPGLCNMGIFAHN